MGPKFSGRTPFDRASPWGIREAIKDALDPAKAPGKVRTWKEMTTEERRRIEERHGIQPPTPKGGKK